MPYKFFQFKILFVCAVMIFSFGCIITLVNIPGGDLTGCNCNAKKSYKHINLKHVMGIIVPFRDRFEELLEFLPHMDKFLKNQSISYLTFVINQIDDFRFNRASLINVGFKEAVNSGCDYIVMHDVDLLPLNHELSYMYPKDGLFHISSPHLHPRYHYPTFLGGILLIKKEDFEKVNGMSNKYWGWGLEDDEFYVRVKSAGLKVHRPSNITTGTANTFRHIHDRGKRKRDTSKCFNQKEVTRRRDRETGVDSVLYKIESRRQLTVDGANAVILNTYLRCNKSLTPWCSCTPSG